MGNGFSDGLPHSNQSKKPEKAKGSLWVAMSLPEEITIFGVKLRRNQYLTIGGIAFLAIIAIWYLLAKSWVKKQIDDYYDISE